jgi:hypothetical protein
MSPERRSPEVALGAGHETTTKATESSTMRLALSRSLGAARLLAHLRGPREHRAAILKSARRRIFDAGLAIERMLDELTA